MYMAFILFVAFIALLLLIRSAHTKISILEQKVSKLETRQNPVVTQSQRVAPVPAPPVSSQPATIASSIPAPVMAPVPDLNSIPVPTPIPVPLDQNGRFASSPVPFAPELTDAQPFFVYAWFKEHTLIKIGSIIFFFGAAWFVTYAFDQNWVPPIIRIVMGLLLALVVYGLGIARERIDQMQYVVLTTLGTGIVFVSVLAAQFTFSAALLPPVASLIVLVAAITYTVYAALRTNTEWLAVAAAVAALFAPQFTGAEVSSALPFFTYLLFVSAGLGFVVLFTAWRYVTLTLVSGVSIYSLVASGFESQQLLIWFFVILFSLLFLGLTSVSVIKNRVPLFTDGVTLLVTGLLYAYFVHTVALLPAVSMFAAAAVVAGIGYVARLRQVDPNAVLLYAVCSIVATFAGTAYLFDGVTATLFFAIEAAALVFFAMRFAFLQKTIYLSTATFALPVIMGLVSMASPLWENGVLHSASLAVIAVSLCLGGIGLYMYQVGERADLSWLKGLSSVLLAVWYGYTVLLITVFARGLAAVTDISAAHSATGMLLVLSVALTVVALMKADRVGLRAQVLWSYVLPVGYAVVLIIDAVADGVFTPADFLVLFGVLSATTTLSVMYAHLAKQSNQPSDSAAWYVMLWTSVLFFTLWIVGYYTTQFSADVALTVSAITFTGLCYAVINLLLRNDVTFTRITPFVSLLLFPALALLPAFDYRSWDQGVLSIDAVSLYVFITLLALLARTFFSYAAYCLPAVAEEVRSFATGLLITASGYGFILVWAMSHAMLGDNAIAVSISLFVYTCAGLSLYVFGKRTNKTMYVRAGYLLLVAVVLRLGLIDVWDMEPVWQIITFLGVGALFIIAALFEKKDS